MNYIYLLYCCIILLYLCTLYICLFFVNLFFRYKSVRCTFENRQDTGSAARIWLRLKTRVTAKTGEDSLKRDVYAKYNFPFFLRLFCLRNIFFYLYNAIRFYTYNKEQEWSRKVLSL